MNFLLIYSFENIIDCTDLLNKPITSFQSKTVVSCIHYTECDGSQIHQLQDKLNPEKNQIFTLETKEYVENGHEMDRLFLTPMCNQCLQCRLPLSAI